MNWATRRKVKRLKKQFRLHTTAAKLAGANCNASAHQQHYQAMRDIYAQLRELDPACPSWADTRKEQRRTLKERKKRAADRKIWGR